MLSGGGSKSTKETGMETKINEYLSNEKLRCIDIGSVRARKDVESLTPFDIVAVQESEQINVLIDVIRGTLEDLLRGLRGELNITENMETLQNSINLGKVPAMWTKYSYMSMKVLAAWKMDLIKRLE